MSTLGGLHSRPVLSSSDLTGAVLPLQWTLFGQELPHKTRKHRVYTQQVPLQLLYIQFVFSGSFLCFSFPTSLCILVTLGLGCGMWDHVPDQGQSQAPPLWKQGVLGTGLPGKPPLLSCKINEKRAARVRWERNRDGENDHRV